MGHPEAVDRLAVLDSVPIGEALARADARFAAAWCAGRFFDAVAALLGVRHTVTYEGQAAIDLEALAPTARSTRAYPIEEHDGVLDPAPLLAAVLSDLARGVDRAVIAAGVHAGLAASTARTAARLAGLAAVDTVALSGGVFANVLLSDAVTDGLVSHGLLVLQHAELPPGDGSISIGQAAVAAARLSAPEPVR